MNKKIKRMLSAVSAMTVCAVSLVSMNAGAKYNPNYMGITHDTVSFTDRHGFKFGVWQEINDYFEDREFTFFISDDNMASILLDGNDVCYWGWMEYYGFNNVEDATAFKKYLTDNNIEYEESRTGLAVYPLIGDVNKFEYFQFAKKVKEDTGLIQGIYIPQSSNDFSVTDVVNALPEVTLSGDANCDGEVTISDAVLIMQNIANPDEFEMTVQGQVNADVTGDGDGVTLNDALEIQQMSLYN